MSNRFVNVFGMTRSSKIFNLVSWTTIDQFFSQIVQLLVFFVLARLIPKEAFGLVALAAVFSHFF